MKKTLLASALLLIALSTRLSAQTTIPTWYIIPPTSGCNGVWAVDASILGACGQIMTYNMSPPGCVQLAGNVVADTMFWPLCNFPCDLTMIGPNGGTCICGTGTILDLEPTSVEKIVTTYPNPSSSENGWNILLNEPGSCVTVNIYNTFGQLVSTQSSDNSEQILHVNTSLLSAGTYFTETIVDGAAPYRQKLILTQ